MGKARVLSKMYSSVGMLNRQRGKDHGWALLNQNLTALNVNSFSKLNSVKN
jgi:hypothetical protein